MPPNRTPRPYNSVYDADPARYHALRSCWLNQRRGCFVETWLRQQPAGPVLELGSGTGMLLNRLAAALPDREFCGLDPLDFLCSIRR
jgi:tRNA G46 methylase TrmB